MNKNAKGIFENIGMVVGILLGIAGALFVAGGDPAFSFVLAIVFGAVGAFIGNKFAIFVPILILILALAWAYDLLL